MAVIVPHSETAATFPATVRGWLSLFSLLACVVSLFSFASGVGPFRGKVEPLSVPVFSQVPSASPPSYMAATGLGPFRLVVSQGSDKWEWNPGCHRFSGGGRLIAALPLPFCGGVVPSRLYLFAMEGVFVEMPFVVHGKCQVKPTGFDTKDQKTGKQEFVPQVRLEWMGGGVSVIALPELYSQVPPDGGLFVVQVELKEQKAFKDRQSGESQKAGVKLGRLVHLKAI